MKTGSYLKARRKELGLTLEKLAKSVGVTRQTLSRYENGVITNIPMDKITRLAEAMHTTPAELLGWHDVDFREYQPNQRVPILGRISAGLPLYAEEHVEGFVWVEVNGSGEYFALRVKGDSMDAAHIFEGNLLIVRKQDIVENGEIAVVMIDGNDATVKRFYRQGSTITLMPQSTNPEHLPPIYDTKKTPVHIIGKLVKNEIIYE